MDTAAEVRLRKHFDRIGDLLDNDLGDHPKPATRDHRRSGPFFGELFGKGIVAARGSADLGAYRVAAWVVITSGRIGGDR
jgi:hypothetical protein